MEKFRSYVEALNKQFMEWVQASGAGAGTWGGRRRVGRVQEVPAGLRGLLPGVGSGI